jgi:hypothetical protein
MTAPNFILKAMSRHSTDPDLSEQEVSVLLRREQHGWFVNRIFEDATGPAFAYSFGLYEEFGHPEIIIFGLPLETMHHLINDIGNRVRDGHKYSAGDRDEGLLRGYSCLFGNVSPRQYPRTFAWAM